MANLTVSSDVDAIMSAADNAAIRELLFDYASITTEGNSTETDFSGASSDFSAKSQVVIFSANGTANGATPDHTNDHITIAEAGVYQIAMTVCFSGGPSDTCSFAAFKNNGATQLGARITRKLGTGGDVGAAHGTALASLSASETVELWCQNESDTSNILIQDATLTIFQID